MMALSNAEKQKRGRDNRLAKQASSVEGLIAALARAVKGKTDQEIQDIANEVWDRLWAARHKRSRKE
jgi:hypothetical protein